MRKLRCKSVEEGNVYAYATDSCATVAIHRLDEPEKRNAVTDV